MAASTKSYIKYELSGVARDQFPFEFPYLDVSDITVELPLGYAGTYTINASTNTVELSQPISVGTVLIRRRTAQVVKHIFANLMRFNFKTVDENFKQCLYWFQEAMDSFDFFSVSAIVTRIDEVEADAAHAVAGESAARSYAILAEQQARADDILREQQARAADILKEQQDRASAILSEASNRAAAITEEINARAAAIQQEASDRAASVAAEAAARGTAVTNEQTARQNADTNLAQQITTITAAGTGAFDATVQWNFDTDGDAQGWVGAQAAVSVAGGWLRSTATDADHWISCTGLSLKGALYPLIRARIRRVAGSGWDGRCVYYKPGLPAAGVRGCPQPDALKSVGGVAVLEWDMSKAEVWHVAWSSSVLDGLRIDLGNTTADVFEIDWIAVGRNAPGASVAGLQAEQTARQSGDSANAASITTLTARLNGGGDIATSIATAQSTANAAVSTGSANASAISALQSSVGTTNANLTTESNTRSAADSALSSRIDSLTTTVNGNTSAITAEQTARVNADSANAQSISNLSTNFSTLSNNLGPTKTWVLESSGNGSSQDWGGIQNPQSTVRQACGRSYGVVTFDANGNCGLTTYDVFGSASEATSMTAALNALPYGTHVAVVTYDEPRGGKTPDLISALVRCGATTATVSAIPYRGAYMLLGIAGIGEGGGTEYLAATGGDANASLIQTIQVCGSRIVGLGGNAGALRSSQAYVQSYAYSKSAADSAMAAQSSSLTAAYQSADATTLTTAKSYTESWGYAKSAVDSAIASASQTLTTAFQNADASTLSTAKSYVQSYSYSKSAADSAIASATSAVSSRLNSGGDIASSIADAKSTANAAVSTGSANSSAITALQSSVGTTNANLTTESSTRASADSALSSRVDALTTTVSGNTSAITAEQTARVDADSALSSRIDTLTATASGNTAAISSEASTRASAVSAVSSRMDTLVSDYKAADSATLASANAYTGSYSYTKAAVDAAIASASQALTTAYKSADAATLGSAQSYVQNYAYSKSAADSAIASSTNIVNARLNSGGDVYQSIVSVTSTANAASSTASGTASALSGTWQVQIDAGGRVSGLKLYGTGTTSGFIVSADKVLIGDLTNLVAGPSSTGASAAGWEGALSEDWGLVPENNYWLKSTAVKSRYALKFEQRDTAYGNMIPVKPGDSFALSMDTVSSGAVASVYPFSLCLYGYDVSGNNVWWALAASRPAGASGYRAVSGSAVIPAGIVAVRIHCLISNDDGGATTGDGRKHYATNIVVRRMNGAELIVDGAVTANKLNVAELGAITATTGDLYVNKWLRIKGGGDGAWGGIRTMGKNWAGDGIDGFVCYRNISDGTAHFEVKAGSNLLRIQPSASAINFSSNFTVDNSGNVTANNIKARGDIEALSLRAGTVMVGAGHIYTEAASITRAAHVGGTQASTTDAQAVLLTVNVSSANMTTSTYIATVQGYWNTTSLNTTTPIFDIVRADGSQVGRMTLVNGGGAYWVGMYSGSATAEGQLQLALQPQSDHSLASFHISMAGLTVINTR